MTLPTFFPPVPRRVLLIELLLVLGVALLAAWPFTDLRPNTKLSGIEMEFLTSSAHTAALALRADGAIPLWQLYLGEGRPLLESPFAFVLNPFSIGPSLLLGDGVRGIKLSVVVYALLAAGGGWFMGRAFRLGAAGRVLLGLLMLGKGNMVASLGVGHFQLGVAQAYMPWIIGAAYLILRGHRARWSVVLLALAVALQFLAGNVWHVLPTLISVGVLAAAFVAAPPGEPGHRVNAPALWRLAGAGLLTIGLAAAVLLPLWTNRAYIGGQEPVTAGGRAAPVLPQLAQYVTSAPLVESLGLPYGERQSRYNFTVPWWLLAVALAPLRGVATPHPRRLWWVVGGLVVLFTLWGLGGQPPFRWLYDVVPGLGRWRFVGRAYGMASVWLALGVVLRLDALQGHLQTRGRLLGGALAALMLVGGLYVALFNWREWVETVGTGEPNTACLAWLVARDTQDDPPLAVYQGGYRYITAFLDARIRQTPIEAAYRPLPLPYTAYNRDLRKDSLPRYALPVRARDLPFLEANGYRPLPGAPLFTPPTPPAAGPGQWPCAWEKPDALPYAYRVAVTQLDHDENDPPLARADVTPVTVVARGADYVGVAAPGAGGRAVMVVAGEVAYPGWQAWVDGERVPLESVGGVVGARLPLSTATHAVAFVYRPVWVRVCLWLTVLTAAGCGGWLLAPQRHGGAK